MTDTTQPSGNGALWFIVGALVVAVIGFGVWFFAGQQAAPAANDESGVSISVTDDGMSVDTRDEE